MGTADHLMTDINHVLKRLWECMKSTTCGNSQYHICVLEEPGDGIMLSWFYKISAYYSTNLFTTSSLFLPCVE